MSPVLFSLSALVVATAAWPIVHYGKALVRKFWKTSTEFKFFIAAQSFAAIVVMMTAPKHW